MTPLLSIRDLSIDFITEGTTTEAVKNISLDVNEGEILAIVGESGSGKSVTALSILRLLPSPPANYPTGEIIYRTASEETDLLKISAERMQEIRGNSISMIFQEPMTSLNPVMSCGRQVAEAVMQHKPLGSAAAREKVLDWFRKVKLPEPERIYNSYPHQLSGGQKQRVMIAMAMCCEPKLLICDEPTTALDVTVQKTILELIRDLQKEQGMSVIFITHDLGVVAEIAHRVVIMYKGLIVEQDRVETIFRQSKQPYTQALIRCRPANHEKGERLPTVGDFMSGEQVEKTNRSNNSAATNEVLVSVKDLTVTFPVKTNWLGKTVKATIAVDDVTFDIYQGETLGIVGESGCGKTTLGRTLLRLVDPTSGQIIYRGQDIASLERSQLKKLRENVQLVFQDPYSSLNPRLSVGAAIAEPMEVAGTTKASRRKTVAELLKQVDLPEDVQSRYPHEFSGGQRQRIVIARALALKPSLLVCDESVSALDVSVQAQVLNLLNDLKRELGLTLVFISHDLSVVRYMSDRIIVMNKGRIEEIGPAEEVYRHTKSDYTKKLLSAIPGL